MESSIQQISSESIPSQKHCTEQATHEEARQALVEVLQSASFRGSKQSQRLLQYVVDHALEGHDDMLKERMIGVNVFGRNTDYDTGDDPIVRVRAVDTRKRLAQYYAGEGINSVLRIELHPGSYRPSFTARTNSPATGDAVKANDNDIEQPPSEPDIPPIAISRSQSIASSGQFLSSKYKYYKIATLCVVAALILSIGLVRLMRNSDFDLFWAPFLSNSKPVLIYLGTDAVYRLSANYLDKYRQTHHVTADGSEFYVQLPAQGQIDDSDLVPAPGQFLMGAAVAATSKVIYLLARRDKIYDLRWGQDIVVGDLHYAPVIFIGGFNNKWTIQTTNRLRFVFRRGTAIQDTFNPQREWSVRSGPNGEAGDDYAIVSRLINTNLGAPIITVSGIGEDGTEAAAEFITNPDQVNKAASRLPVGWNRKNMQIVLHVKIVDGVPSSVNVVDAYCW